MDSTDLALSNIVFGRVKRPLDVSFVLRLGDGDLDDDSDAAAADKDEDGMMSMIIMFDI